MSKSNPNPSSRILLNDNPTTIREKIHKATTDSLPGITFDQTNRPGISNLLQIEASLQDRHSVTVHTLVNDYTAKNATISDLKANVAKAIINRLGDIGERYEHLISHEQRGYLAEVAELGAKKAGVKAAQTMSELREHLGMSRVLV